MTDAKLYKKTITVLFIIAISGIVLFLHINRLDKTAPTTENFANISEQNNSSQEENMDLNSLDNLNEEAAAIANQSAGISQNELEDLLRQLEK
jgi:hypothetical protein